MQSTDPQRTAPAASRAAVPVEPGDVIAEKYRVERVVGAGGVGVVVHATHLALGEGVAIKLLQRSSQSEENLLRFEREARALARIKSEHVARIRDTGTLPSGEPFLVMDLLLGEDFGALIKRETKLEIARAVDYLLQACEAVVQAHARGIVHRDLKPANLFLTQDADGGDLVKVLDFGISKLKFEAGIEAQAVTQTLSVIGSPLYMSPEQMETPRDADEASDVWSLGIILHELVTGRAPFEAPTLPLLCARICTAPPTRLTEALPGAPEALESLILRALDKDKTKRYPSVAALAVALAPFGTRAGRALADRIARIAESERMKLENPDGVPDSGVRRWSWSSSPPPPPQEAEGAAPSARAPQGERPAPSRAPSHFKLAIGAIALGLVCAIGGAAWGKRAATPVATLTAARALGPLGQSGDRVAMVDLGPSVEPTPTALAATPLPAGSVSSVAASSATAVVTASAPVALSTARAPAAAPSNRAGSVPVRRQGRGATKGDVFSER
jgi:serine/threonine-protein kinase